MTKHRDPNEIRDDILAARQEMLRLAGGELEERDVDALVVAHRKCQQFRAELAVCLRAKIRAEIAACLGAKIENQEGAKL